MPQALAALAFAAGLSACAAAPAHAPTALAEPDSPSFVPPEIDGYLTANDLDGAALIGPPTVPAAGPMRNASKRHAPWKGPTAGPRPPPTPTSGAARR